MTTYGVTSTGFVMPTLDDIVSQVNSSLQGSLGSGLNLIAPSVFATLVGIIADREFALWQAQEAVYNSQYTNTASGQSLDNIAALAGLTRRAATAGTVTLSVNLNAGVTLPSGQIVSAGQNTAQWITTANATNSGGSAANVNVAAQCQTTGPIQAVAGALTTIVSPFSGWNSVTNPLDAVSGQNIEADAGLRARIAVYGPPTVEALRAKLLALTGVTQAVVFDNVTDVTDANGVPPHAIQAVVSGGADADIENLLWQNVAEGIQTYGSTSGTITDTQGFTHTLSFSRPTIVPIYVIAYLLKGANYPGDAAVQTAIAAYGSGLIIGESVLANQLFGPVYGVGGIPKITAIYVDPHYSPVSDSVAILPTQQANFTSIVVVAS